MKGISPPNGIPRELRLYLACCPKLDLNIRFLPNMGGYLDQEYDLMERWIMIESKIMEIRVRDRK